MKLSPAQYDILNGLVKEGLYKARSSLKELIQCNIDIQFLQLELIPLNNLLESLDMKPDWVLSSVSLDFWGGWKGSASLIFALDSAAKLVTVLTGRQAGTIEHDSGRLGALCEIGNLLLNGVLGSISNGIRQQLFYSLPDYREDTISQLYGLEKVDENSIMLLSRAQFNLEELSIQGYITLPFNQKDLETFASLLNEIRGDLKIG